MDKKKEKIKEDKLPANYYFDNNKVEQLIIKYHETGCTDIELRNEIMSHSSELIVNVIRTHNLHGIYAGGEDSAFGDLYQTAWQQIESTLYKFDAKPGHSKIFNMWCMSPDTLVITPNGIRELLDVALTANTDVFGIDGFSPAVAGMVKPESDTLVISTEYTPDLICSPEHQFKTQLEHDVKFVEASDLSIGDCLMLQYNQRVFGYNDLFSPIFPIERFDKQISYLLGLLISNHAFVVDDSVIIRRMNPIIYARNEAILSKWGGQYTQYGGVILEDPLLVEICKYCKMDNSTRIPTQLTSLGKHNTIELLRGMVCGQYHEAILLETPYESLLNQTRMMWMNIGVLTKVHRICNMFYLEMLSQTEYDSSNIIEYEVDDENRCFKRYSC